LVEAQGTTLAALALRFALARASRASQDGLSVYTIIGICSINDVEDNLLAIETMLQPSGTKYDSIAGALEITSLSREKEDVDLGFYHKVQETLGEWAEYDFQTGKKVPRI
jgi:hypothetical protein